MGCTHSSHASTPRVSAKRESPLSSAANSVRDDGTHPLYKMFRLHKSIMGGVAKLPRPDTVYGVSCLSTQSFPLSAAPLKFDDSDLGEICLPTIGVALHEHGRVMCIGNIEILTDCKPDNAEFLAFMENILRFASGPRPASAMVLLLDIDRTDAELIQKNISGLGFGIERFPRCAESSDHSQQASPSTSDAEIAPNFAKYSVVLTMSDTVFGPQLYDFVKNGGGLICCARNQPETEIIIMNKYLAKCGISFFNKNIVMPPSNKSIMKILIRSHELEPFTFPYQAMVYQELLMQNNYNPDINLLFVSVTYLMLYLLCFERDENDILTDICNASFDFLIQTKFMQPDGMFFSLPQRIVAMLLSELFNHLPVTHFEQKFLCQEFDDFHTTDLDSFNFDLSVPFPGEFVPEAPESISIKLTIQTSNWHSTGLYLPAGYVSEVTVEDQINTDSVFIQIGSHSESLIETDGPWKRWPIVIQKFPLITGKFKIGSPFGGLIYIVNQSHCQPTRIGLNFTNVVRSIYFSDSNTDFQILPDTHYPPWGEIQTRHVCFTLPTNEFIKINDIQSFPNFFDSLVQSVFAFTNFKPKRRFRIVFDYGLPEAGSSSSYPLMMSHEMIAGIFEERTATSEIFAALMMIAIVTLPENALEPNVEAALGALASAHAFCSKWPDTSPMDFTYLHMNPLFNELWEIYSHNDPKLIMTALTRFRSKISSDGVTSHLDSIQYLISEMESISGKTFPQLLENATIKLNQIKSYPSYKMLEEEDE